MIDIRDKALKEQQELRERLAELEAFLAVYERLSSTEPEQIEAGKIEEPTKSVVDPPPKPTLNRPSKIAEAAAKVIRQAGKPLTRGEIVEALEEAGMPILAADKGRYLGTILWRKPEVFVNLEGRGYWLKELPLPPNPQTSVFE